MAVSASPDLSPRLRRNPGFAVKRLGNDERPHHVLLPDQFRKNPGSPLAGENLGHRLKMILEAQLMKIDALIGLLDSRVRQMLVTVADVVASPVAEAHTGAIVVAELKTAAELALGADRSP